MVVIGHVKQISGGVFLNETGSESVHLVEGMSVYKHSVVTTDNNGYAEILFENEQSLIVGSESQVLLDDDVYLSPDSDLETASSDTLNQFLSQISFSNSGSNDHLANFLYYGFDSDEGFESIVLNSIVSDQAVKINEEVSSDVKALDLSEVIMMDPNFDNNNLDVYFYEASEQSHEVHTKDNLMISDDGNTVLGSLGHSMESLGSQEIDDNRINFENE